jgi:hypothetical protein
MIRNYLKGILGDNINTIMAATGFNLMKKLNQIRAEILWHIFQLFRIRFFVSKI